MYDILYIVYMYDTNIYICIFVSESLKSGPMLQSTFSVFFIKYPVDDSKDTRMYHTALYLPYEGN